MKSTQYLIQIKELVQNNKLIIGIVCLCLILLIVIMPTASESSNAADANEVNMILSLENELEEKLEKFLSNVEGVGKVKVCVTFDVLEKTEYARDEDVRSGEKQKDSSFNYVIIENKEGDEGGLAVKITAPEIRGVAVCCEGAERQLIKNEVTLLLSAVLNVPTNRVYVTAYNNE